MNRLRSVLLLVLLVFGSPALLSAQPAAAAPANALPGELIVRLQPGAGLTPLAQVSGPSNAALARSLRSARAGVAVSLGAGSDTYRVQIASGTDTRALIDQLNRTPGVRYAQPNYIRKAMRLPNDPVVRQQWALRNIKAQEAWDISTGGEIVIASLDTGVSSSHPDLGGKVLSGYNFYANNDDPSDDNGHGTYTAGVAAAYGDNNEGIAGVCWGCLILPVKVLGARGNGDDAAVAQGIRYAVDHGARVINLSLGSPEESQLLHDAVIYAHDHNVVVVASSGNGQAEGNQANYPAAYPEVIAVSATDGSDTVSGFSTTGDYVDMAAPGVGVWSTGWEQGADTYSNANGTSAAAPYVSGGAALVLSVRPELNADQVRQVLERSADDVGAPGKDANYGYGRLNLARALQLASDPNLTFTPEPPASQPPAANPSAFAPVGPPSDGSVYFGETSHTLRGEFLAYWRQHGGLPIFGFPISEQFMERSDDGQEYTVQYFQRHRFEYHPENTPPYNVLLSRIGVQSLTQSGRDWFTFAKGGPQNGCLFFEETGHSLCGAFLNYWRANGLEFDGRRGKTQAESLALFGMPLSEPQVETLADGQSYTVQWFERGRFEDHGAQGVLLGLLSDELTRQQGRR